MMKKSIGVIDAYLSATMTRPIVATLYHPQSLLRQLVCHKPQNKLNLQHNTSLGI